MRGRRPIVSRRREPPGTVGDALPPVRRFLLVDIGRLLLFVVAAIALSFAGGAGANAASLQWDANGSTPGTGGSGTWNTSTALWFNGISFQAWSNAALDDAVFGGTAGTVTLGTSITAHSLGFNVTGYTVTGSTLTLGGVSPIISVVPFADAIIRSTLAGTAGLTVTGDRHAHPHRRQHLHRRHDDQRRQHAATRQRHQRWQRRRRHRRQRRARVQPQQRADLCRCCQR